MSLVDHDLHVHTYLSSCCHDGATHRPSEILRIAAEMGTRTVGFADHVWANPDLEPSNWYRPQDETQIARLRRDLASVMTDVRVLVGCEAETVAPGAFGITRGFAEELDFVLLACSHFHMRKLIAQPAREDARGVAVHAREFFVSAARSGLATAIPHPLMPCGYEGVFDDVAAALSDGEIVDTFGAAAEGGVGVEITTSFLPPAPGGATWSLETPLRLLELAKKAGCLFTFASDAHDLEMLKRLPELEAFARRLGLSERDILPLARA
jgi:histidinol phosphatase-like PHP family hydrolase